MAPPSKKELPSKEKTLFKELLNLYETRQLKKGVKTADQILKKFPENGETLCMKGLILTHMGKREEGIDLVKKGIRFDLTSHIVWHVFGLIQKGEKNYEEALKSYTQALRFDKENLNLLQDAANLQTHLRLYDALQDTRQTMLKLRPTLRRNWVALAVAYHLNGNLEHAKKVLQNYEATLKNVPDYDFEHSEVMLYYVRILEELGEVNEALSALDAKSKERVIVDRTAVMEARARLLSKLDKKEEAEQAWRDLIGKNSDCYDYYHGFFREKGYPLDSVSDETRDFVLKSLQEFSEQQPRARAPRRLALTVSVGEEFKTRAQEYLKDGITRGIPSLFSDIKSLYKDRSKQDAIEEIVENLKTVFGAELPNGHVTTDSTDDASEPPTSYLWTLYFLAQHYSHLGQQKLAVSVVDVALAHTPTLPELHTCRARALKRAGDPLGALINIEEARKLDGQDRFLNTKSAKYHLRANLSEEAQTILGLFTKKDAPSPAFDLEEMQSLLYLTEEGDAQIRLGRLGPALKKYLAVVAVFDDIWNDQYDFHQYSIRRFILNVYVNCIRWEDRLWNHPAYIKSAVEAVRIYVRISDDPELASASTNSNSITDAEKKAQKKARKAAKKNQEETKKLNANSPSSNEDKGLEPPASKDEDPDGTKALTVTDTLEQAWKLLKPLTTASVDRVDVCLSVYDVSVRREKYLQAAKTLLKAQSLDAKDPELHIRVVDFKQRLGSLAKPLAEPVESIVRQSLETLLPSSLSLETFNSQYLQQNTSPSAVLAAVKVLQKLNAPVDEIEGPIFGLLHPQSPLDLKSAKNILQFMKDNSLPRSDEFRSACDERFELSTIFKTADEIAQLSKEIRASINGTETPEEKSKPELSP